MESSSFNVHRGHVGLNLLVTLLSARISSRQASGGKEYYCHCSQPVLPVFFLFLLWCSTLRIAMLFFSLFLKNKANSKTNSKQTVSWKLSLHFPPSFVRMNRRFRACLPQWGFCSGFCLEEVNDTAVSARLHLVKKGSDLWNFQLLTLRISHNGSNKTWL